MNSRHKQFVVILFLALAALLPLGGQLYGQRKDPVEFVRPGPAKVLRRPPGVISGMGRAAARKTRALSAADFAQPDIGVQWTGVHLPLEADTLSTGTWGSLPDGTPIWRLRIESDGALGLRIQFSEFSVADGSVWVSTDSPDEFAGPYSGQGPWDDGEFWSSDVNASGVTIEYVPGSGADTTGNPPFHIVTVSHRYVALDAPAGEVQFPVLGRRGPAIDAMAAAKTPVDPAASCNLDVSCYPDWASSAKSVANILFEITENGVTGQAACSGSLLATRDNSFIPYFLTAGHCIHNEASARSMQTYWAYQTSACYGPVPTTRGNLKSSDGATLLSWAPVPGGDFSLVLLKDVPSGVTFSGWDIVDPGYGGSVTGIHHPRASYKRISFGTRSADQTVTVTGEGAAPASLFLAVTWTKGVVEPGSSGSPLFSGPGVVSGMLSYGPSVDPCIPPQTVGYGRMSNAYYAGLNPYLENLPAAAVLPASKTVQFTLKNGSNPPSQVVNLTTQTTGTVQYRARADAPWISVLNPTGSLTASAAMPLRIAVNPALLVNPGNYASTITILSGAAAPQYINVKASVSYDQSRIVVTATPNPVAQDAGGVWTVNLNLQEKNGVETQITQFRINGQDYTSSLVRFFGSAKIPASGSLNGAVKTTGLTVPVDGFFEFFGQDPATKRTWYQIVTVRFVGPKQQ